ncbi:MAG: hypothetical protein DI619_01140 [Francisella sp.]|nr:MAG: hypothetical protein DI619_01140 [Francisella sp.]
MLVGSLNSENIREVIKQTEMLNLNISSGVERRFKSHRGP